MRSAATFSQKLMPRNAGHQFDYEVPKTVPVTNNSSYSFL